MISDQEVEDFLEHFGVKGQKWGVRKAAKIEKYGARGKRITPTQRRARAQRNAKRIRIGVQVAVGAMYVAHIVTLLKNSPAPSGPRTSSSYRPRPTSKSVKDIINAERDTQISSLKRHHTEGHINKEQLDNFMSVLNKRYDRRVMEAVA